MESGEKIQYNVVRSDRKTLSVEVRPNGDVLVRAPWRLSLGRIDAFVASRRDWIEDRRRIAAKRMEAGAAAPLTAAELEGLRAGARTELAALAERYAPAVGVTYNKITIRAQRTRWGSCSARGDLSFNCLLMLAPERVREYVVIHELCHRKHMDHSPRFWAEVERIAPDWRTSRRWLREKGGELLARLEAGRDL